MLKYDKDINGEDILLEVCEKGVSQVMMAWEKPYMEACINKLKPKGYLNFIFRYFFIFFQIIDA